MGLAQRGHFARGSSEDLFGSAQVRFGGEKNNNLTMSSTGCDTEKNPLKRKRLLDVAL